MSCDFDGINLGHTHSFDGITRKYPKRDDYIDYLKSIDVISSIDELYEKPRLISEIQMHWHTKMQTGCVFAAFLSNKNLDHGWSSEVCVGFDRWTPEQWVSEIRDKVLARCDDPDSQILSLIFPEITQSDQLVQMLKLLNGLDHWEVKQTTNKENVLDEVGGLICVGVRLELPGKIKSWGLGVGPFHDLFPLTRLAPFVEIALSTKPKSGPPKHEEITDDPTAAHLADVPINTTEASVKLFWEKTKETKQWLLKGVRDLRAKGRVTFSIPKNQWNAE